MNLEPGTGVTAIGRAEYYWTIPGEHFYNASFEQALKRSVKKASSVLPFRCYIHKG